MPDVHALTPGRLTRNVFNPLVLWLNRRGWSPHGTRTLAVRGRRSGELRQAPVNPLRLEGHTYLVAPRGHVQWTRNLRTSGEGELRLGRTSRAFSAREVADRDKPEILRAYLQRWPEVGRYFKPLGLGPESTEADWLAAAEHFPVFLLSFGPDR